jgi:hypothetical protein
MIFIVLTAKTRSTRRRTQIEKYRIQLCDLGALAVQRFSFC